MGKTVNLVLTGIMVVLSVFMYQCTKKLVLELEQAEKAVAEAKAAEAPKWAPETYQAAVDKLAVAKKLNDNKKIDDAKKAFAEVIRLAEQAITEAKAAILADKEKNMPPPEPEVKTEHTVGRGDFLWKIAAYDDVYGDGRKWYRIYKANQAKIDGNYERYLAYMKEQGQQSTFEHPAQLINAGWELTIPR